MYEINSDALDRHITGNYGEDQYSDPIATCRECNGDCYENDSGEAVCEDCGCSFEVMTWCGNGRCGVCDGCYDRADREYEGGL